MKHTLNIDRKVDVIKIALTGKLRSGKDTVANRLYIGHDFHRVAFGDELKRLAHETFPHISEASKPRALYQQFGQLMREMDPDVWIRHVDRKVKALIDVHAPHKDRVGIVITDLRQPNEYAWAKHNGFSIVRVSAPDDVRIGRALEAGDDFTIHDLAHPTEIALNSFEVDYQIVNDGTVEELKRQVDEMMAEILAQ